MSTTSITVLGSTGTIGQNTLKILAAHPKRFALDSLVAGGNVQELIAQAKHYSPRHAVIADASLYTQLKDGLSGSGIEVAAGEQAVLDAASRPVDITMAAIVGMAGLKPTLAAVKNGKRIALANKECLVSAGHLLMDEIKRYGTTLLPVDSEHNAIFQLLGAAPRDAIEQVTITASGGPFRSWSREQMKAVTPEQAKAHPNWKMGAKISVDSATLMNKALELIEAFYLFGFPAAKLNAIIHPQSIVHCLIRLNDGSVLSQMSNPDMCTPIACALAWPERISAPVAALDLAQLGQLQFESVDETRFPALRLARDVMAAGDSAATVFNAANEIAVKRFLAGEIGFLDIVAMVEHILHHATHKALTSLEAVCACDQETRLLAETLPWNS
ncbi:MAG: 1-deoxy-D-xylulose-5-phosphate reductoisomerase [Rickettsiales bacterium]|nr:1-deoxy-D-xylulose-5-phosphate reductoisomerase [Rickettsiales bacterium]